MIEINLLPLEVKSKTKRSKGTPPPYFLLLIPLILIILLGIHIVLAAISVTKSIQYSALQSEWNKFEPQRKALEVSGQQQNVATQEVKSIEELAERRVNWSEKLNRLSLDLPDGIWFNEVSLNDKKFVLSCSVVSLQQDEMGTINKFLDTLKKDTAFFKDFSGLDMGPAKRRTIGSYDIVDFVLSGTVK